MSKKKEKHICPECGQEEYFGIPGNTNEYLQCLVCGYESEVEDFNHEEEHLEIVYTYWFVRVKEVTYALGGIIENVEDHVFRLEFGSRDKAKKYVVDKYGDLPFRKPKNATDGTKYFYLMPSDIYWYNKEHKEHSLVCEFCKKDYIQVGDTYKSRKYNLNGKSICSEECQTGYRQQLDDEYNTMSNDNYWVDEDKHPLTNPRFELAGYIYKITNKRLMKSYVGKTIKPPVFRWWQHLAVDDKFEQHNLSDLVFEVLEVVYFNEKNDWDLISYGTKEEKLSQKERYYINYYDAIENGYNKI